MGALQWSMGAFISALISLFNGSFVEVMAIVMCLVSAVGLVFLKVGRSALRVMVE